MYSCGPEWGSDLISTSRLERTLSELEKHIVPGPRGPNSIGLNYGLHLTGGEPFLHYDELLEATRIASDLGVPSLFVETNSFWCREDDSTWDKLEELRRAGLKGIMISVNPFYLEYVPFENTKRAVRIGREIFGREAVVYQTEYLHEFERLGIQGTLELGDYLDRRGEGLGEKAEFFLNGRAPYKIPEYDISGLTARPADWWFERTCSPSFLREWHNHVDNYGNYVPGYCGGVTFGNIEDLDTLISRGLDPRKYPVLSLLVEDDFAGLLELARDYGYRELDSGYYSKCHLCLDLRSYLHANGEFAELKPDQFYRQVPVEY